MTSGRRKKQRAKDETTHSSQTRSPRVFATVCPQNSEHERTRVYKTIAKVRYCVCDECGETWKQVGPQAAPE